MKIDWNIRYTTMAVYTLIVSFLSIIFYLIASEINIFKSQIFSYIRVFQPIIIGAIMAYLFNFIMEFYEINLLKSFLRKKSLFKVGRILSVALTYITVFFLFYLFLNFILPQLVQSISRIVNDIPYYTNEISKMINDIGSNLQLTDEYYELVMEKWDEAMDFIIRFGTDLIPKLGNFARNIFSSIWNIVLGLIVSVYLLMDKERFLALTRKLVTSIFSKRGAEIVLELGSRADNIFGRFLSGKILDSFIVGILTFAILKAFNMPYPILISFIIGLTNIIPFFGPFIGAVPSFVLIVFISPIKALWFLIIILVIQQIDGNIIGPKILGDSLGISPFWILFSLLVSGKLMGLVGLIIGVPLFVFIYSIVKDIVEYRLAQKDLPIETKEYFK